MLRRPPFVAALLLAALPLASCGGDGSLSASDLRTRASAICTRAGQATDRVAVPSSADEAGRFLRQGLVQMQPALVQLRKLKAPKDLRADYDQALSLSAREIDVISRHEREIRDGGDAIDAFRQLGGELDPLVAQESARWRTLKIPACVKR